MQRIFNPSTPLVIEVILISHNHGTTTVALSWICKFICMSLCNGCIFNRDWRDWAEIFCCHQLCIKLMIFYRMQWWRCPHQTSKGIHLGEMKCHQTVSRMVRIQYRVEECLQEVNSSCAAIQMSPVAGSDLQFLAHSYSCAETCHFSVGILLWVFKKSLSEDTSLVEWCWKVRGEERELVASTTLAWRDILGDLIL